MKKGYYSAKILIILVELGVFLLLIFSFVPILSNGLDIEIERDITFSQQQTHFIFDGQINVTSRMPWDIGLGYELMIGTEENLIFSETYNTTIRSDSTTSLVFDMRIPVVNVVLYLLSTGFDYHHPESLNIPAVVKIHGDYIMNIVSIDLTIEIKEDFPLNDLTLDTDSSLSKFTATATVASDKTMLTRSNILISFGNDAVTGYFTYSISNNIGTISLTLSTTDGENLITALRSLVSDDRLTARYGTELYTLTPEQTNAMIWMLEQLLTR